MQIYIFYYIFIYYFSNIIKISCKAELLVKNFTPV